MERAASPIDQVAAGELLEKKVESLRVVVHQWHVEHGEIVETHHVDVADPLNVPSPLVHERHQVETHQVVAVVRRIVKVAPSVVIGVNVEPELGKTRQKPLCDGEIASDDGAP